MPAPTNLNAQSLLYVAGLPLQMIGPQIWGQPNEEQQARIAAGEVLENLWHGEMQQIYWGMSRSPALFCQGLRNSFPKLRTIRAPFNKHYWTRDEAGKLQMHPQMEEFYAECAADKSDFWICWDFHDGPTQVLQDPRRRAQWPNSYPAVENFEQWQEGSIYLGHRQIETWNMLFEWLEDRPWLWEQTIGYEIMNEPAAYFHGNGLYPGRTAYFVGRFVDHIEAIAQVIRANDPSKFILAPTWAYNGDANTLASTRLPDRGGITGLDAIRQAVGLDRLIWSIHFYTGFDTRTATQAGHDRALSVRWGVLGGDPVCVTETNIFGRCHDPARQGNDYRHYFRSRHLNWLTDKVAGWPSKRKWGVSWWPAANWAQASATRIALDTNLPVMARRFSTAEAIQHWSLDNHPEWFDGAQSGVKGWERNELRPFNSMDPSQFEIDGWHLLNLVQPPLPGAQVAESLAGWYLSYGGTGTTYHSCADLNGAVMLQVLGGDGKTVIHHQMVDFYQRNHFHLGRGGGVVRLGNGSHVVMSQGGPAIIYTASPRLPAPPPFNGYSKARPHATIGLPYGWDNRVICDPGAVTHIYGFNPDRGDRLSFKGAFQSVQQMRAAMRVVENNAQIKNRDIILTLPGGGEVLMLDAGALASRLHTWNLDLTDGWYAPGWVEPVDYTEAEFTNPIPIIPPAAGGDGAWMFDREGRPLMAMDRAGRPLAARLRDGTILGSGGEEVIVNRPPSIGVPGAILPASGPVGTTFTIRRSTFGGTEPIIRTWVLMLDGDEVTDQVVDGTFTPSRLGVLHLIEDASNPYGQTPLYTATANVVPAFVPVEMVEQPSLSPSEVEVGFPITVTWGSYTGDAPITKTRTLTFNGVNVLGNVVDGQFTPSAPGTLTLSEIARNTNPFTGAASQSGPHTEVVTAFEITDDLSGYYASGAVLIHHTAAGFQLDGEGKVTGIANAGAAGAVFNAAVTGAPLTVSGNGVLLPGDGSSVIATDNVADLVGARLIWAMNPTTIPTDFTQVFGLDGEPFVDLVTTIAIASEAGKGTAIIQKVEPGDETGTAAILPEFDMPNDIAIFELVMSADLIRLYVDSVLVSEYLRDTSVLTFPIRQIGSGVGGLGNFQGQFGDVLGIVVGHPNEIAARNVAYQFLRTQFPPAPPAPPSRVTFGQIAPLTGDVGAAFTITLSTYAGTAPIDAEWSLTLDGVDVTADVVDGVYTSTAAGDLELIESATNAYGSAPVSTSTAQVLAPFAGVSLVTAPSLSPADVVVGQPITVTWAVYAGDGTITSTRALTFNGVDVLDDVVGGQFTPTDDGILLLSDTGSNTRPVTGETFTSGPHTAEASAGYVALTKTAEARIEPAIAAWGVERTITPATYTGSLPITRAGQLLFDGEVVASRSNGAPFTFTPPRIGALAWSGTAENPAGVGPAEAATGEAVHPLKQHFDSGAIQIYLSTEDATLDVDGRVTALQNIGAAGAAFNASIVGGSLAIVGGALQFQGTGGPFAQLANPADIVGVDFCWIMQTDWTHNMRLFGKAGDDPRSDIRFDTNATGTVLGVRRYVGTTTTTVTLSPRFVYGTAKSLYRMRMDATAGALFENGVQRRAFTHAFPDFRLQNLGQGTDSFVSFNGKIGDIFGVVRAHPNAAQALADASAYAASKHGIILS
ncbi:cellulase family glycosylhydrolase [Paracoccus sp. ME4]|uniref:cellulase family glycosylhydrolase n=1 Tax=Paracoccus sp. ME4 TaxID=3138066 RepID=UPI00398A6F28